MRTVAITVVLLCACDQGAIEKPKPAATVAPAPVTETWRLPDAPFSANAWRLIKPGLTFRGND